MKLKLNAHPSVVFVVAFFLASALVSLWRAPTSRPHVILITVSSVRADQLGAYGNPVVQTPVMDGLASEGFLVENAITPVPSTLAAHASLFTGQEPRTHGVPRDGFVLADDRVTLAEVMSGAGYTTAGFISAFPLHSRFGIAQGFSHWDEQLKKSGGQPQRPSHKVVKSVTEWAEGHWNDRLFLFAHFYDVHAPYQHPAKFRRYHEGVQGKGGWPNIRRARGLLQRGVSDPVLNTALRAEYAAGVSRVDVAIASLLDNLNRMDLVDDALVIVTSDHGEAFEEHDEYFDHGATVHDETVRVPLIIRRPIGRGGGQRIGGVVSTVDVMPTLLDFLNIPVPDGVDGQSFADALRGEATTAPRTHAFVEAAKPYDRRLEQKSAWPNAQKNHAVRSATQKLLVRPLQGTAQGYDLASDPGERQPLAPDAALQQALDAWHAKQPARVGQYDDTPGVRAALGEVDPASP